MTKMEKKYIKQKEIKVIHKIGNITLILQNKFVATIVLIILSAYIFKNYKKNKKLNSRHKKRIEYEKKIGGEIGT